MSKRTIFDELDYYNVTHENLADLADDIECERGCEHASYDPETNHTTCKREELSYCKSNMAQVIRCLAYMENKRQSAERDQ